MAARCKNCVLAFCTGWKACCTRATNWQSAAVVLSIASVVATFAAIWSPWWAFISQQYSLPTGLTQAGGALYLWEMRSCITVQGFRTARENGQTCTLVRNQDFASDAGFAVTAGNAAMTLASVSLPLGIIAAYLTYVRRLGSTWRIPDCCKLFRQPAAAPILQLLQAGLLLASVGVYINLTHGQLQSTSYGGTIAPVVSFVTIFTPLVGDLQTGLVWGYWAGPGLAAAGAALCLIAAVTGAICYVEQPRAVARAAAFVTAGAAAAAARQNAPSMFRADGTPAPGATAAAAAGAGAADVAAATPASGSSGAGVTEWGGTSDAVSPAGQSKDAAVRNPLSVGQQAQSQAGEPAPTVTVTVSVSPDADAAAAASLPGAADPEVGKAPVV